MEPEEQLISLNVVRLTRPTLDNLLPITCDSVDLLGNLLNNKLQIDPTSVPGSETLALGQFLLLPQNPVNIYLGETFTSYVVISNETKQIIYDILVKAVLQTNSQRIVLLNDHPHQQLNVDQTVDIIMHHEVKEIGPHILAFDVSYQTSTGVLKSLKKCFKIQVLTPLDVKTKFYNDKNDDIYLEVQVQNTTSSPIYLEKVYLNAPQFVVKSMDKTAEGENVFGNMTFLQSKAICQYVYLLTPNNTDTITDSKSSSEMINIGKFDIVWRSYLGEKGRLQTSQLETKGPAFADIKLLITDLPNFVYLEELFTFKCKLTNNGERNVEFILYLENTKELAWCDISGRQITSLQPHESTTVEFKCIPLSTGLKSISGVKLVDTFLKRTYTYDKLGEVFVIYNYDNKKIETE